MPATDPQPGELELRQGTLIHRWNGDEVWTLPARDIAVIGEYTTPNGPYVHDYFFIFVDHERSRYEASFYSGGRDSFLEALGELLGGPLECGLCHSTDFNSRVAWPPALSGGTLFEFVPPVFGTFLQRLGHRLAGTRDLVFSGRVEEHLSQVEGAV